MVRTAKEASEKLADRIKTSRKYMEYGVRNPREDWEKATLDASEKRNAELTRAIAEGRIDAGIKATGTAKQKSRSEEIGVKRWVESGDYAGTEYSKKIGDVLDAIEEAKAKVKALPETTVEERAEKSKQYQIAMSEAMKKKRGY